jgi:hypothetical protein
MVLAERFEVTPQTIYKRRTRGGAAAAVRIARHPQTPLAPPRLATGSGQQSHIIAGLQMLKKDWNHVIVNAQAGARAEEICSR